MIIKWRELLHIWCLNSQKKRFLQVKYLIDVPSIGQQGCATQFSAGKNYWSKSSCNNKYYYTVISCLSGKKKITRRCCILFTSWNPRLLHQWHQEMYCCLIHYGYTPVVIHHLEIHISSLPMWKRTLLWRNAKIKWTRYNIINIFNYILINPYNHDYIISLIELASNLAITHYSFELYIKMVNKALLKKV